MTSKLAGAPPLLAVGAKPSFTNHKTRRRVRGRRLAISEFRNPRRRDDDVVPGRLLTASLPTEVPLALWS
jgi:hypothetical protein